MKTLIHTGLLFLLFLTIQSCSSNDDSQGSREPIVGIWQPLKYVEVCSESANYIYDYSSCEQKGRLTIKSDGTFSESFFNNFFDSACSQDESVSGNWNINNGKLDATINGEIINITFFELLSNNLKLGQYDDELGCVGPSTHYYTEYIRVN